MPHIEQQMNTAREYRHLGSISGAELEPRKLKLTVHIRHDFPNLPEAALTSSQHARAALLHTVKEGVGTDDPFRN